MKAKDLRIGNWVVVEGNRCQIIAIDGNMESINGGEFTVYERVRTTLSKQQYVEIQLVNPIPILRRNLLLLGFSKVSHYSYMYHKIDDLTLYISGEENDTDENKTDWFINLLEDMRRGGDECDCDCANDEWHGYLKQVHYVHEIQNIIQDLEPMEI